jgi:serine protease
MSLFNRAGSLISIIVLLLSGCGGGGGGYTPAGGGGGGGGGGNSTLACPTSGAVPQSASVQTAARRRPARASATGAVPGMLAVVYSGAQRATGIDAGVSDMHPAAVRDLSFDALGTHAHVISVDPARTSAAISRLQKMPGVISVSPIAYRQKMTIVSNDPYYGGFGAPAPYYETATTPGEWDMHLINAEAAWNTVAGSASTVVGATAPIAVVDTGADLTHPELSGGKVKRTECYVTYPSGTAQTTGTFVTDTDGHGTDVAGIADGDTGNGLGFASVAYDANLMIYRIFPTTPSGGCDIKANANNAQCTTTSLDESSAINDAIAHGAKVINLSLGGSPPCSTGDLEYQAVENAIAHNVVVVAAAGNGDSNGVGQPYLDCPAADPGVIAAGASAVDDSVPGVEKQYVASYSNYLTTSGVGHFMVAPGGDPTGNTDTDDLHWIEHIYSSTAVVAGTCTPDFESVSSTGDCRIEIAGTSQATPHIVGAAALVLAARPSYTAAQVAAALCNSATNIGDSKQGCGQLDANAAVQYALAH